MQAADIAASKSAGLTKHYGMTAAGTRFWDVHVTLEVEHAGWSVEALADLGADAESVRTAAKVAADALVGLPQRARRAGSGESLLIS